MNKVAFFFVKAVTICFLVEVIYWHEELMISWDLGRPGDLAIFIFPTILIPSMISFFIAFSIESVPKEGFIKSSLPMVVSVFLSLFFLHVIWFLLNSTMA